MPETATYEGEVRTVPHAMRAPGPSVLFLLKSLPTIKGNLPGFLTSLTRQYGDVVRISFLNQEGYLLNHPAAVKHILQSHHLHYSKDVYALTFLKALLGEGLLTSEGASWLRQRRLMQPAFHRKRLSALSTVMTDATCTMLESWQGIAQRGEVLDISQEMMRLTLRNVGLALLSRDLSNEMDRLGQAFAAYRTLLMQYLYTPFPPLGVPTPRNRRLQATIRELDTIIEGILAERRKQNIDTGDLLSILLQTRDEETGEGMTDRQVRDEVMTLLLAGHETTATALTWTWYLLSQHPLIEDRLHAELDQVLSGQPPSVEHLPRLPYTRMILEETLRLYPPTFSLSRRALVDDEIGGYALPAKSTILLCPYTTHRHPAFWEDPDEFKPERFLPERAAGRPHFAYFPFGGGPRQCIGNQFALMEAQLILATVAQRYRLRLAPQHRVEAEVVLTIRPRHGLPMTLQSAERPQLL
jgi:cytochrome P450